MFVFRQRYFAHSVVCLFLFCFALVGPGCNRDADTKMSSAEKSDPKAIAIADSVMAACGGRANWDATRYLAWRFFGKRLNVWDKVTGDVRVESRGSTILMNLESKTGRAWKDEQELTDPADVRRALDYGYEAWVNDSYWVFMPFKLRDDGVILKYLGEGETKDGEKTDILSVTFENVGLTPENKYEVQVDKKTHLVVSWSFYMDASDEYPRFTTPWKNYKRYGKLLLSDDRGEKKHTELGAFDKLPESVFKDPEPFEWAEIDSLNRLGS